MKKVVVFGMGNKWEEYRDIINENYEVVAYVDNYKKESGGTKCFLLEELQIYYDLLIITPIAYAPIYSQCLLYGIDKEKIVLVDLLPEIYMKRAVGGKFCYGQHYEDLIISAIFSQIGIDKPSYLDLGANHPYNISNTALLYLNGSHGVNIDANSHSIDLFNMARPNDKNVNVGVATRNGEMTFYEFSTSSGLNTFSKDDAEYATEKFGAKVQKTKLVNAVTLDVIIDIYCNGVFPDYLDCDIEGFDYEVLRSYDLSGNGPKVICVEIRKNKYVSFDEMLSSKGFFLFCRIGVNSIYVKNDFKQTLCGK